MSFSISSSEEASNAKTALGVVTGLLAPIRGPEFDVAELYEELMEICDFTLDQVSEAIGRLENEGWLRQTGPHGLQYTVLQR
jgi:hypothetical protein